METRAHRAAVAFFSALLALCLNACAAAATLDNADVASARELLDSWSGQGEVLEEARARLAHATEENPQNYLALKEMARYEIMAGYIHDRYVSYHRHIFSVGEFEPGTLDRAEVLIRNALQVNPKFAGGYVLLGHIETERGDLDAASKALAQAEALGTDDPWLQLNWAAVDIAKGEPKEAEKRWRKVLQSNTTNRKVRSSAYGFLLDSYKQAGQQDQVVGLYEEMIRFDPNNAWLRGNFAEYLSQSLGRNDEAIAQARAALDIMDYGVGERILAMALYRKWAEQIATGGDEANAERNFAEARDICPGLDSVMAQGASLPGGERLAKALIARKGVSIDARDDDGSTALLIATNRNSNDIVRALLDLKANPNIAASSGWTPLLSAADEGNAENARLLLEHGADPRATLQGADAAELAARKGYVELAGLLKAAAEQKK